MTLKDKLNAIGASLAKNAPPEVLELLHRATENLRHSGIMEKVRKIGDRAPEFELPNAATETIRLHDLLADGPVVLNFYRGKW